LWGEIEEAEEEIEEEESDGEEAEEEEALEDMDDIPTDETIELSGLETGSLVRLIGQKGCVDVALDPSHWRI